MHSGPARPTARAHADPQQGQLARLLGYKNASKGANKVIRFEQEGTVSDELLVKLAEVLDIELTVIEGLVERDRQEYLREWERWVNEPVPMQLLVKLVAAWFGSKALPEYIKTPEEAQAYACELAKGQRKKVCLVVSRRLSIWINEEGRVYLRSHAQPDQPNVPWVSLQGSRRRFLFGLGGPEGRAGENPPPPT